MISTLDEQVGDLVAKLMELGIYENTLIIFTSDNGPTYAGGADTPYFESAKPFKTEYGWGKGFVHEGGIRVPMIASWPKYIEKASESGHISAFYDFMPTFRDVAGSQLDMRTDGISLLPELLGNKQLEHEFLYWEFPEYKGQQAVRIGKWKAIRQNILEGNLTIELYDLESDPQEQVDVATAHPEIVQKMKAIMEQEHIPSPVRRFQFPQLGD